jgi:hypothetical protein
MSRSPVFLLPLFAMLICTLPARAQPVVHVKTPLSPPTWALLERELLKTSAAACEEFFARYFDERGYLMCVERWGGDDGPDDAIENCNDWPILHAQGKKVDGVMAYPHMCGDAGWYDYKPEKYKHGAEEIWYWSMRADDRKRLPPGGWLAFLEGKDPAYPETLLRQDLAAVCKKVQAMRADTTTPDTRLADDPLPFNPAAAGNLVRLMLGGLHHGNRTLVLNARVRYFDPDRRRAGLPADVAALVEGLDAASTTLTLVNVNQLQPRTILVQAGGYGEHQFTDATIDGKTTPVNARHLLVRLDPGAGAQLVLSMRRYVNIPTLDLPWQ